MAYSAGDVVVEIKGTGIGNEIWSNSWGVTGAVDAASRQLAVDAVHAFYNDIAGLYGTGTEAAVALVHDKFANVTYIQSFAAVAGTEASKPLPTQLAVRVSLKAGVNIRGGPFLTGFSIDQVSTTGGLLDSTAQATIVGEVEDLYAQLDADGMALAIDSPTNLAMFDVVEARVGQRFDVIRKRANDILEDYVTATL